MLKLIRRLSPFDPIAYAGVGTVLTMIALAATVVAARRATRIDPIAPSGANRGD